MTYKVRWRFNFPEGRSHYDPYMKEVEKYLYVPSMEAALHLEQDLCLSAARLGVKQFMEISIEESKDVQDAERTTYV